MIYILYTRFNLDSLADFEEKLCLLPPAFREKILSYRRWEDRIASLYGKLLLRNGLNYLAIKPGLEDLRYSEYQRPYLTSDIDFNISHSGNYVAFIISNCCRVGIDIEELKEIDYRDFSACFSDEEWQDINSSACSSREFFNYWTRKEAVIKADGKGLSIPLKKIDIRSDETLLYDKNWYIYQVPVNEQYAMHFAVDTPVSMADITVIGENI